MGGRCWSRRGWEDGEGGEGEIEARSSSLRWCLGWSLRQRGVHWYRRGLGRGVSRAREPSEMEGMEGGWGVEERKGNRDPRGRSSAQSRCCFETRIRSRKKHHGQLGILSLLDQTACLSSRRRSSSSPLGLNLLSFSSRNDASSSTPSLPLPSLSRPPSFLNRTKGI